jgi:hypothetical protein
MLAADGHASGWDNPACYIFCAVWVPPRGGLAVAIVRSGQLTDVRVARFNTRICVPMSGHCALVYLCAVLYRQWPGQVPR